METARERYFITNTMLCLLKGIEGMVTTVELRNEREVSGRIVTVDGFMNLTMADVVYKVLGKEDKTFSSFFVNGKSIRYVHIPDEVDMRQAMKRTLTRYCSRSANIRVKQEIQRKAWEKMKRKESEAVKEEKLRQRMKEWDNVQSGQSQRK